MYLPHWFEPAIVKLTIWLWAKRSCVDENSWKIDIYIRCIRMEWWRHSSALWPVLIWKKNTGKHSPHPWVAFEHQMTIQSPLVYGLFILASSERYLHHCAFRGSEPRTSRLPVECSTDWAGLPSSYLSGFLLDVIVLCFESTYYFAETVSVRCMLIVIQHRRASIRLPDKCAISDPRNVTFIGLPYDWNHRLLTVASVCSPFYAEVLLTYISRSLSQRKNTYFHNIISTINNIHFNYFYSGFSDDDSLNLTYW